MTVCRIESSLRKSSIVKLDKLLIDYESEYHFLFSVLYNFAEKKQREVYVAQIEKERESELKFLNKRHVKEKDLTDDELLAELRKR